MLPLIFSIISIYSVANYNDTSLSAIDNSLYGGMLFSESNLSANTNAGESEHIHASSLRPAIVNAILPIIMSPPTVSLTTPSTGREG